MSARRGAALVAAVALLSAALGGAATLGDLGAAHDEFAPLSDAAAELRPARHERLPTEPWPFFRRRLEPGDRYALRVAEGAERGFVTEGTVARTFANFFLLPALQVLAEEEADVVLVLGEGPPRVERRTP